jgi:DNA-binding response OmpR family regulator
MKILNGEKKRILFVEDHQDTWELVARQLTCYEIVIASDYAEGLRLARQRYFDLYILDNWLPDGTGVELCRRIRAFDPNTPVLFYSAVANARDQQEALSAGAQEYLVKPVGIQELTLAIAKLISATDEKAFNSRGAELATIREELATQRLRNASLIAEARERRLRAQNKALRVKARLAFLSAGGTRGDFARQWASGFLNKVREESDG